MTGAPHVGSRPEHDWLIVGSITPLPAGDRPAENASVQNWVAVSGAFARELNQACGSIVRRARTVGGACVTHCASAAGHLLRRVGQEARGGGARSRALKACRAHPVASLFVSVAILCLGYLAYCMATVPLDGGLIIEPTPSALVVEADGGQGFAQARNIQGQKAAAQKVPFNLAPAIHANQDPHLYQHHGF